MSEHSIHELAKQVAVLEERMNTKQAEYTTDIARLAEQHTQLEKKLAERDTKFILLFVSLTVGATAFLSLLIKL